MSDLQAGGGWLVGPNAPVWVLEAEEKYVQQYRSAVCSVGATVHSGACHLANISDSQPAFGVSASSLGM